MPVYEYRYDIPPGLLRGAWLRWGVIPRYAWAAFFRKRLFIWIFTIAWIPLIIELGWVYFLMNEKLLKLVGMRGTIPAIDASFFRGALDGQVFFCFVCAFLIGAGEISQDLRHGAIALYASKPIALWEYVAGKFISLFTVFMVLSFLQGAILFVVQAFGAPEHSQWRLQFWDEYAWIAGAIMLYSLSASAVISLLILAFSSLSRHARYAGISFCAFVIGSQIVFSFVDDINKFETVWRYKFAPIGSLYAIGSSLFSKDGAKAYVADATASWIFLAVLSAVCVCIIFRQVSVAARTAR